MSDTNDAVNYANGVAPDFFAGWLIAYGACRLIGRPVPPLSADSPLQFSPVYELQVQIGQGPAGLQVAWVALPPLMLCSVQRLVVPPGCVVLPVDALPERETLVKAVKLAHSQFTQARVQENAQVQIAGPGEVDLLARALRRPTGGRS